ncbi:hypothetical protein COOONC_08830 [Cooperia oncophora]
MLSPALDSTELGERSTPKVTATSTECFSNASWGDGDAMVSSHATYIVPPGRSALEETEDCDLMSIPAPKSILSYRERSTEEELTLGTSVVLDESRVGVENLPVVEDDDDVDDEDDLQTPLVEAPQWHPLSSFAPPPSIIESMGSPSADGSSQGTARDKDSSLRANSRQSDDTGYNEESDASRLEHRRPLQTFKKAAIHRHRKNSEINTFRGNIKCIEPKKIRAIKHYPGKMTIPYMALLLDERVKLWPIKYKEGYVAPIAIPL